MRSAILALSSAALLTVALLAAQPAAGQSAGPSLPCNESTLGTFTKGTVYSPPGLHSKEGSWDVYEYICNVPSSGGAPRWIRYTYPVRSLKTQIKPSGFRATGEFDSEGPVYIITGNDDLTNPLKAGDRASWHEEGTLELREIMSGLSSAKDICTAVDDYADNVTPANMYYVDGAWHYIWAPHLTDLPLDARMSNIWRNVPECRIGVIAAEEEDE